VTAVNGRRRPGATDARRAVRSRDGGVPQQYE
jgi:hypothetical protein